MSAAELLRRHGLRPKRSLGQNFLVDEAALARVTAAAQVQADETVLEIGPGLGALTRHLAAVAQRVVAVELDQALIPILREGLQDQTRVTIVHGDILEQDISALVAAPYCVVANIPYYITSAVVRHVLEAGQRPRRVVLTMQREVAERICAPAGDLSLLAISVQVYARAMIASRIPAGAFYPRPEVDSAVLRLEVLAEPRVPAAWRPTFFHVVKVGFSQKRKQLRNALRSGLSLPSEQLDSALAASGIDGRRRAETLTLDEWLALAQAMCPADGIRQ
jgi:16S rRNA (adenine1518-N6/adenine1519-N6)-dimethyltransferase